MTPEELLGRLALDEGPKLEFKQEYKLDPNPPDETKKNDWTKFINGQWDELIKDVIALTNGTYGTASEDAFLIIGVGDKPDTTGGRPLYDTGYLQITSQQLLEKVNSACSPPILNILCSWVELKGKKIFVIRIPFSPFLHEISRDLIIFKGDFNNSGKLVNIRDEKTYTKQTAFIRRGAGTYPATAEERQKIKQEKEEVKLHAQYLPYLMNTPIEYRDVLNCKNREWKCISTLQGHSSVLSLNIGLDDNDDNVLVSADRVDMTIKFWNIESCQLLNNISVLELTGLRYIEIKSVALSPNNKTLAIAPHIGEVILCDFKKILKGKFEPYPYSNSPRVINAVTFARDSEVLIVSDKDNIELWMVPVQKEPRHINTLRLFSDSDAADYYYERNPQEKPYIECVCLAVSHDGRKLAGGLHHSSGDNPLNNTINIWDFFTPDSCQKLLGHPGETKSIAFSPNRTTLASGGCDNKVRLWNIQDGQEICPPLEGHYKPVCSVTFSPDGRILASGSADGTIRLWNPINGKLIASSLQEYTDSVNCITFTHDGQTLISGSSDGTIKIWQCD